MPGKGFSHTPNAGEFRKYSSWGRTRSPKNILSSHRSGISATGTPLTLEMGVTETDTFTTENQRYLHVVIQSPSEGARLAIVGQMYAAATFNAAGNPTGYSDIPLKDTSGASLAALTGAGYHLVEIGGIDKIKFTLTDSDGGNNASIQIYAACSTFSMT
jgi:hypothetical protein